MTEPAQATLVSKETLTAALSELADLVWEHRLAKEAKKEATAAANERIKALEEHISEVSAFIQRHKEAE
jgi:phage host-nuclease inhibitor protein Gam